MIIILMQRGAMRKGMNALEIIFGLFVLIIVVLVIIRMFTENVKVDPVTRNLDELNKQEDYKNAINLCEATCSDYQLSNCDISRAIKFCTQKVSIDLDNNNEPGEKSTIAAQHGAIVAAVPICEDGMYCFHVVEDCRCGSVKLTPDICDALMCEYYVSSRGLTLDEAKQLIKTEVNTGSCDIKTKDIPDYQFLDRDTTMDSGKNWFDLFGMGDCQKSTGSGGSTASKFSITLGTCEVTVAADRKSANFECAVLAKSGSCTAEQIVVLTDENENTLMAMTGDVSMGSITVTEAALTGVLTSPDGNEIGSTCTNFVYTCGDNIVALPTSCTIS
jgi:hypothetical protein